MSIASEITRLQGVKSDILQAIADKGVTIPTGSALDDCPDLIASIETEGPDLSGYIVYDYFIKTGSVSNRVDMTPATSGFAANFEKFLMSSYDNTDYKVRMKMRLTGDASSELVDSNKVGLQHNFRFMPSPNYFVIELPCTSSSYPYVLLNSHIDFSSDIELTIGNNGVTYNGTTYQFNRIGNKATAGIDYLYLRGQWNQYNGSTFYYYEIEYKGKIVNRLVPAKRKSDSNLGWLDEKTGEFYVQNGWEVPAGVAGTSLCVVEVNSSSGDVVTATDSRTTIQSDTGRCFFCLPFSGTWIFVCNGVSKSVVIADNEYKYISFEESTVYQNGTQGLSLVNGQHCTFGTDYISFTPDTGDYCAFVRTQNQITGINPKRIRGKFVRDSVEYTFDEELTEAISGKYLYITFQSTSTYNAVCVGYDSNIVTPSPVTAEQIQLDYSTNAASNIRLKELYLY